MIYGSPEARLRRSAQPAAADSRVERALGHRPARAWFADLFRGVVSAVAPRLPGPALVQPDDAVLGLKPLEAVRRRENATRIELSGGDELGKFRLIVHAGLSHGRGFSVGRIAAGGGAHPSE